jgi:pimeloyl-ACP methyl ester carboxylesterase
MTLDQLTTQRRRAKVGPVDIHYQEAGAGEPLVLIHGLSGSGRWWSKNIAELAAKYHVYVVDLIGFGASRNGHPFVLKDAAAYLARWMELLGIARASLVGHSMGGHIAADLAADYPERVERLILVDAAVLPFEQRYVGHALALLREARQMALGFLPILFGDALRAGVPTILKAAGELFEADLRPKLERISAPTLVIWGENDALIPAEAGKRLSRYLRYDELVIVKRAGHNPMWDCPRAFNQVVVEFLESAHVAGGEREIACDKPAPRWRIGRPLPQEHKGRSVCAGRS